MPGATASGLPYPLPTEPVRDGANAVKALADALEKRGLGLRFVVGQVIVTTNAAGGWGITYPSPFGGNATLALAIDGGADGSALRTIGIQTGPTNLGMAGVAREPGGNFAANANIRITYLAMGNSL